ncbi:hypothetical protein GF318_03375 [Candidatus Micrarchaeota archaeon]|nr:hypothetical protein [Candidatus Micrarchaeota archaeon]
MGKSVFLKPVERKRAVAAQFRKLRDELEGQSLMLDGACSDRRGRINEITGSVKDRMKIIKNSHPVQATLATMMPSNLPSSEHSWLDIPFAVGSSCNALDAGGVACTERKAGELGPVRAADLQELTLLSMAVMRNLGVEAHYGFMHLDHESPSVRFAMSLIGDSSPLSSPCIILPESGPVIATLVPPYVISPVSQWRSSAIEVLDDRALLSLLKIKAALGGAVELMEDMGSRPPAFEDEGRLRAISIGHLLYEGITDWTLEEAGHGCKSAQAVFNTSFQSIRAIFEKEYVHGLTCPLCHSRMAGGAIFCDELKGELGNALNHLEVDLQQLSDTISDHACMLIYQQYMGLAAVMQEHIHPAGNCKEMGPVH